MKTTNSLIAYLLLVALMLPVILGYGFIKWKSHSLKEEIKQYLYAQIDPDELILLKFSHREARIELEWEHESEFEYKGSMFDVLKSSCSADSVFFWCWADQKDSQLNKTLESFVDFSGKNDPINQQTGKKMLQFYKSLFTLENIGFQAVQKSFTDLNSIIILNYKNPIALIIEKPPCVASNLI